MKVTLLIPTLNEIDGMKEIMPRIDTTDIDQVLISDGGSTDGTLEWCRDKGYSVYSQKKPGLRYSYIEAMPYITGNIVITFSPDGNSIPERIPELISKMKQGFDMVIVSRYAKGAKSYDDDFLTGFGNWMFTFLINLLFRGHYTDVMVMFRAWKKQVFSDLNLDKEESYIWEEKVCHTKIGIEPLLSIRAAKRKLNCADIPGDEPRRIGGERKLQAFRWGAAHLIQIARESIYWHL